MTKRRGLRYSLSLLGCDVMVGDERVVVLNLEFGSRADEVSCFVILFQLVYIVHE